MSSNIMRKMYDHKSKNFLEAVDVVIEEVLSCNVYFEKFFRDDLISLSSSYSIEKLLDAILKATDRFDKRVVCTTIVSNCSCYSHDKKYLFMLNNPIFKTFTDHKKELESESAYQFSHFSDSIIESLGITESELVDAHSFMHEKLEPTQGIQMPNSYYVELMEEILNSIKFNMIVKAYLLYKLICLQFDTCIINEQFAIYKTYHPKLSLNFPN